MSRFLSDIDLDHLNTFRVSATAETFLAIDSVKQLLEDAEEITRFENRLVLGGGSNLLFVGDFKGLVIYPKLNGIKLISEVDDKVVLRVAASENWHEFVYYCLQNNYFGLENLALIPGTVGAAPVQNIGAYGVEVKSFIQKVECFDLQLGRLLNFSTDECQFAYRDSFIKKSGQGKYLVTSVDFVLSKQEKLVLSYKPLYDCFKETKRISAIQLFDKVCEIRTQKLPDPKILANAGSFFKNPVINKVNHFELKSRFPELVSFLVEEDKTQKYKVAAGWLIEKAGFKGKKVGKVGVHQHQALVLVNYSESNGKIILNLAEVIIAKVEEMFDIRLQPEVCILGLDKKSVEPKKELG